MLHGAEHRLVDVLHGQGRAVSGAGDDLPAQALGGEGGARGALAQEGQVALVDVLLPAVPVVAAQEERLGDLHGHVQVDH